MHPLTPVSNRTFTVNPQMSEVTLYCEFQWQCVFITLLLGKRNLTVTMVLLLFGCNTIKYADSVRQTFKICVQVSLLIVK